MHARMARHRLMLAAGDNHVTQMMQAAAMCSAHTNIQVLEGLLVRKR